MMDAITIRNLEFWTHIGVSQEERMTEQRLLVTVEMALDTRAAAKTDDVAQSINYKDLAEDVLALAKEERKTIERLAEDCATMILARYKPASVTVDITKFPLPQAQDVRIRITRPS